MKIYVVQPGDTVYSIANKFNLPVEKIVHDNNISPDYGIVNGQIIILAYPTQTYMVQPGDTWKSIAEATGLSIVQLLQNNPFLSERDYLNIGEELVISYDKREELLEVNAYCFSFIDDNILKKALPYLTYITIANYRVSAYAEIEAPDDTDIIQVAKEYGVAPIMMITTATELGRGSFGITHKIFNNEELQNELINNIIYYLRGKGLSGINFGFSNVIPEDLQSYVNFIIRTAEILQSEGYQVHVTLIPNTFGYHADENNDNPYYSQIGQVVDRAILQSYTWASADIDSYEQTTIPFLKGYVEYAITQIPAEKILLGYTRIAYDWELPYVENESPVNALANYQALSLAHQIGIDLGFDEYYVTPYFRYYNDGIEHFVWFKDARTLHAILDIVIAYNLSGISIWNTMDFTPQLWVTLNSQFNISKILNVTSEILS
ncbi:LysM peptidoglycan-binding domain-containing protein [Anaerocolumna sedimenticola]|uniref:LysM peptidoglycan-binding domain-containing protein n=1 Tax=Anaerocolumna sedimenticola TaxID=2696063 RepID=A0A6P1TIN3_9FIRM|nr:LysM peptidoglycan-binding domain-containing protein [Anaerocolumna sedimenticola]QHQ60157.1 LysM peptidoglycan-binding domain-containing protein [Anaerocolumna sedimenticola]